MSPRKKIQSRGIRGPLATAILLACCLILSPGASAAESPTHVFDALHSLTGDCSSSSTDAIPDPGPCPIPPGVKGVDHPSGQFVTPTDVATDSHGDVYVSTLGKDGHGGVIDIFGADGHFISEIVPTADEGSPGSIAVDGDGHLYAFLEGIAPKGIWRFDPATYEPANGEIDYGEPPINLSETVGLPSGFFLAVRVDSDGHLFVGHREGAPQGVEEYGSSAEGNAFIGTIGGGTVQRPYSVAIDNSAGKLFVSDSERLFGPSVVRVFALNGPAHPLLQTIDGCQGERFHGKSSELDLAAEESDHRLFVRDEERVYEFTDDGTCVGKLEHSLKSFTGGPGITVDNALSSPDLGYLYVPSGTPTPNPNPDGHLYAFAPLDVAPPQAAARAPSGVTTNEAVLRAEVNPSGVTTRWALEYTTLVSFEDEGFGSALVAGQGVLPVGKEPVSVSAPSVGLTPGTAYRFRVTAVSELGEAQAEGSFSTYPAAPQPSACSNAALRTGAGNALPDCRAYELVSPPQTNGRSPVSVGSTIGALGGVAFGTPTASPDGNSVGFLTLGGAIPGEGGAGGAQGDAYVATRGAAGWQRESTGLSGAQSAGPFPGGSSPELAYTAVNASGGAGNLAPPEGSPDGLKGYTYIRYPDGTYRRLGQGSIGEDPIANPDVITSGAGHIIFGASEFPGAVPVQLEPDAPPSGTQAVYDRTTDGVTHVVSLLPGDLTPAAGENATYSGASADGEGIAFTIGGTLYERLSNTDTLEVGAGARFAGISSDGRRILYLEGGNLFAFDEGATEQITTTGAITPVNLSADGSHVYFISPSVITPGEANFHGDEAQAGADNLYAWDEGTTRYMATVTERDVVGEKLPTGGLNDGLGLWLKALESKGTLGIDSSRVTPDGSAFIFESRANLTAYDAHGMAEIYRYQDATGELACLSCLPAGLAPSGDASLQSVSVEPERNEPTSQYAIVRNLSADGRRAFFQSPDPLVPSDGNGRQDVYEWEGQGEGGCTTPNGCTSLISAGRGGQPAYLYGASVNGDDVFFSTSLQLLRSDTEETPSIYDARVDGGFAEGGEPGACQGEACKPQASSGPVTTTPGSVAVAGGPSGNLPKTTHHKKKHHKKKHHKHGKKAHQKSRRAGR